MTHQYEITGMTCTSCQAKVQQLLSGVPGVKQVAIDLAKGEASIEMNGHIATNTLQAALAGHPKYQLSEARHPTMPAMLITDATTEEKTWLGTYTPILLIFGYITVISLLATIQGGNFHWMRWMNGFMAGFFLVFSFFKLLDIQGFSDSYSMYDIVAKRWNAWGLIYPFVELALGISFLVGLSPLVTNWVTLVVMSVSIIGVLQSVFNKRKIRCACLGAVFNLPMSTITIIEDALMIGMSAATLAMML